MNFDKIIQIVGSEQEVAIYKIFQELFSHYQDTKENYTSLFIIYTYMCLSCHLVIILDERFLEIDLAYRLYTSQIDLDWGIIRNEEALESGTNIRHEVPRFNP